MHVHPPTHPPTHPHTHTHSQIAASSIDYLRLPKRAITASAIHTSYTQTRTLSQTHTYTYMHAHAYICMFTHFHTHTHRSLPAASTISAFPNVPSQHQPYIASLLLLCVVVSCWWGRRRGWWSGYPGTRHTWTCPHALCYQSVSVVVVLVVLVVVLVVCCVIITHADVLCFLFA
jgi:hypothetical protein